MLRRLLLLSATCVLLSAGPVSGENLTQGPFTTDNDESCDIGVAPAATLLLPYFEVDVENGTGTTSLFSVTNTGERAQVARVTLWTDRAYPVLTFDIYLTGYDVQSINLFDVIGRGMIGGGRGTGTTVSPKGDRSRGSPLVDRNTCGALPTRIDQPLLARLQAALRDGVVPECDVAGNAHEHAIGYATIDVVGNCTARGPLDPLYFSQDIRYENALIGDYVQLSPMEGLARGAPMVHIRALPEGGTPRIRLPGPLPRLEKTFYGRFQKTSDPHLDARQPLPSTFAVRWINGGAGGFQTRLMIWRNGYTGQGAACGDYERNGEIEVAESVSFDEDENGLGVSTYEFPNPFPVFEDIVLPATSLVAAGDADVFPQETFFDSTSGWLYLNLDDEDGEDGRGAQQNWVVATMHAEGRFSVALDAAVLGNSCSPAVPVSDFSEEESTTLPGPAEDVNP